VSGGFIIGGYDKVVKGIVKNVFCTVFFTGTTFFATGTGFMGYSTVSRAGCIM
jgi:hypothetical protein